MPSKGIFVVMSNPAPGREEDFEAWYDNHMKELHRLPWTIDARRYRASPDLKFVPTFQGQGVDLSVPYQHFAVYRPEGDVAEVWKQLQSTKGDRKDPEGCVADGAVVWGLREIVDGS